jgi:hypothetical protein
MLLMYVVAHARLDTFSPAMAKEASVGFGGHGQAPDPMMTTNRRSQLPAKTFSLSTVRLARLEQISTATHHCLCTEESSVLLRLCIDSVIS